MDDLTVMPLGHIGPGFADQLFTKFWEAMLDQKLVKNAEHQTLILVIRGALFDLNKPTW